MAQPPKKLQRFLLSYPDVGHASEALGDAAATAGPLNRKTLQLVKLGISIGMRHEGAVHALVRQAPEAGCTSDEVRHATVLAVTTLGFPSMFAAYTWVDEGLRDRSDATAQSSLEAGNPGDDVLDSGMRS